MRVECNMSEQLKKYADRMQLNQRRFRKELKENALVACEVAKSVSMAVTPHIGDGKPRGKNMITNALRNAWRVRFEMLSNNGKAPSSDTENIYARIIITNSKKYAPYVQYGHRMTPHFVPWLYKDGAVISRENTHAIKMFGLLVGTKTTYVPGVDMIGPIVAAFNKSFNELNEESFKKIFGR